MKYTFKFSIVLLVCFTLFSCNDDTRPAMDLGEVSIIPRPLSVEATGSSFKITSTTSIYSNGDLQTAEYLSSLLKPATGFDIDVKPASSEKSDNPIIISFNGNEALGNEEYSLEVTEDQIQISANHEHGIFNAIQTLRQMLPAEIEKSTTQSGPWLIPTGTINDKPEFGFRGAMLDVARHFFEVKDVKRMIDLIAQYKINYLHLHLTDDQGWRIEIKSWPNLTTHGGSTQVGGGEGGFYTQEEYKDIVNYAASRFITIVPEIDMPGHTNAALSSYPELNCDGKAPDLYTGTEVGFSTFCTSKGIVYKFINDVVKELAALTPGPYIHIGGDESHVTELEDYIPFIERTSKIVKNHGKEVMGWDEIAHAKLPANSVVHYWAEAENAKKGVEQNAKVLMSPAQKTYLDMQYDTTTRIGLHWAAYIEVDSAYMWDPNELVEGITKENILGVESPLWSETVVNMEDIEYLVFPRLICHSEIGWTPAKFRNWDTFKVNLGKHKDRMDFQEIGFYPSKFVPWQSKSNIETNKP